VLALTVGAVVGNACAIDWDGTTGDEFCAMPENYNSDFCINSWKFCVNLVRFGTYKNQNPAELPRKRTECVKFLADFEAANPHLWPSESDAQSIRMECVSKSPDFFKDPQPVWFGPKAEAPKECHEDMGAFGGRYYFNLYAPSSEGCAECACGPIEGSCSPTPNSIQLHSGSCNEPQSSATDFGPPGNWDGSCTNNHSVAANAECPAGSGIPCAQSVYISALPDPTEGCKPVTIPVPKAISDAPAWREVALSCNAPELGQGHCQNDEVLVPTDPNDDRWHFCVLPTKELECKTESRYPHKVVVYSEHAIIDHRSCTECECKATGGECYASFSLYEDDACSKLLTQDLISSDKSDCNDINPPGLAVGSKKITDLSYQPGKCEPTGGVPVGNVEADPLEAVTWCCTRPVQLLKQETESQ
jgi:hypothetical protein